MLPQQQRVLQRITNGPHSGLDYNNDPIEVSPQCSVASWRIAIPAGADCQIEWAQMSARMLLVTVAFLVPAGIGAQTNTGPAPDVGAIHHLINLYAKAVDTVDLNLLSQIWSHSPEVSFVYPLGEEHGFDAIEQHVFRDVMGGMFSARDLETHKVEIHANGNEAWSEFHWVFHATMRKDGSTVTTHGVETQIYRKEIGKWRLVHVHYSEDHQSGS